jgi:hypothetical protein
VPTIPYRVAHIRRLQKIEMVEDQTDSRLGGPEEDRPTPTERAARGAGKPATAKVQRGATRSETDGNGAARLLW